MALSQWTDVERCDLKYMVENGFKTREICEVLGKSSSTINNEIKFMQLKSPRKFREKDGKVFCLNCRVYKSKDDFYKSKHHKLGYCSWCKECSSKYDFEKYHNKKLNQLIEEENKKVKTKEEVNGGLNKTCSSCKTIQSVEEFNWKQTNILLDSLCRKCRSIARRKSLLKRAEEKGY